MTTRVKIIDDNIPRLSTPEIQSVADELLETAKLAAFRAVSELKNPNVANFPSEENSLERILLKRLKSVGHESQKKALENFEIHNIVLRVGRTGTLKTETSDGVLKQYRNLPRRAPISLDILNKEAFGDLENNMVSGRRLVESALGSRKTKQSRGQQVFARSGEAPVQTEYRELQLRVHKLECVKTTSGGGNDEISLDGLSLTANGTTKSLSKIINNKDFHHEKDNDLKYESFNPPKVFARFKFKDDDTLKMDGETYSLGWPRVYSVTFLMAEIDNGSFADIIKEVTDEVKLAAHAEVKSAVLAAIDEAGGVVMAKIAEGITHIVEKITEAVIALFTLFLTTLWEDNIFSIRTRKLYLSGPAPDDGEVTIKKTPITYTEHGGHYKLYFDWHFDDVDTSGAIGSIFKKYNTPSPAAIDWYPTKESRKSRPEIFLRGMDRNIYRTFWHNNEWWPWGTFSDAKATFKSTPAVTSWKQGRLELFALGDDDKIYQNSLNNMDWSGWNNHFWKDFLFQYGLATTSRKPNYVDLFAVGMDRHIYNFFWNGQAWSGLRTDLPAGTFRSAPAVVSRSTDRLDVVTRGDDRRIYISSWKDSWGKWSNWSSIGIGTFTSAPTICTWDENRLHVFARGDDRKIYHSYYNESTGWSNWGNEVSKSGTFLSGPTAVSKVPGLIDLYAIGDDQNMWRNVFNGTKWSGWFNDFKPGTFK